MFLYDKKSNSMICDFQLIYESDGRIMFDLYSFGMVKEPASLDMRATVNCIDCGLISISKDDFGRLENQIKIKSRQLDYMKKMSEKMIKKLERALLCCQNLEQRLYRHICSIEDLYQCFDALTDIISYRRISDLASDQMIKKIGVKKIKEMNLFSYLDLLDREYNKLGVDSSGDDFETFIREYAYLYTFDIEENPYENISFLKEAVGLEKRKTGTVDAMHFIYHPFSSENETENIYYDLSWYSELKHILQLRILRNFRIYMRENDMNIITTDAGSLFKDVQEFRGYTGK